MTTLTTTIHGLRVELDTDTGSDPGTQCDISKGRFQASLAALEDTGVLCDFDSGDEYSPPQRTVDAISAWATKHGY
jgi:hypothetical protein